MFSRDKLTDQQKSGIKQRVVMERWEIRDLGWKTCRQYAVSSVQRWPSLMVCLKLIFIRAS